MTAQTLDELIEELENIRKEHGGDVTVESATRFDMDGWFSSGVPVTVAESELQGKRVQLGEK